MTIQTVTGYRAVLDAFQRFPRFSRAGSTAFGSVPPAKVFVIGSLVENHFQRLCFTALFFSALNLDGVDWCWFLI